MITYEDFVQNAPPGGTREERDDWFRSRDIEVTDLFRVGTELATHRLAQLQDGDQIGESELLLALQSSMLFGVELCWRVLEAQGWAPRS